MNLSDDARQVLLDMKARLAAGWMQGRLSSAVYMPGETADISKVAAAEQVCFLGAAIAVSPDSYSVEVARPGMVFLSSTGRGTFKVNYVLGEDTATHEALAAVASELGVATWEEIGGWNDDPARTLQDVIDLIDRVLANTAPDKQAPDRAREEMHA